MAASRVTWSALGVSAEEKRALRAAGLAAVDLLRMAPLDLVVATDDAVDVARAEHLVERARLLERFTLVWVEKFASHGITSCEDLAAQSPDDLFLQWQDTSPYTRPDAYRILAGKVADAGGPTFPIPSDDELVRRAWVHRFGDHEPGEATGGRLRILALGVSAPVWSAEVVAGIPVPPLDHRAVSVAGDAEDGPLVVVGHWQWAGHFAAFLRLEELQPGDDVELADGDGATRRFVVTGVRRGPAPLPRPANEPPALLLLSPPHLRWKPWCADWDDPDLDPERTFVQVAVDAELVEDDGR